MYELYNQIEKPAFGNIQYEKYQIKMNIQYIYIVDHIKFMCTSFTNK